MNITRALAPPTSDDLKLMPAVAFAMSRLDSFKEKPTSITAEMRNEKWEMRNEK
jgi:hypothetical protein